MPTAPVIRDFAKHAGHQPQIEPDVIETLVEFKDSYFDDPHPAHWTVDVLQELLLDVLPRKVTAPEDWFAAVVPTARAYVEFLQSRGRMAPGSDSATALLSAIDRTGDGVLAASQDPRNYGMAKAIFSRVGFDPSLPDPARAAMEAFNDLSDAERAAILDPSLRGAGPGGVLQLPFSSSPLAGIDELPAIWLPPARELAAAVRQAPLVRDLLRLVAWNGARHKVTRSEVLPLPDARRACADLGLAVPSGRLGSAARIPALHRLWILALETELLQVERGAARRGEAADLLTDPDPHPDAVVSWWVELLDTCLLDGLDLTEDFEAEDLEEDEDDEPEQDLDEIWDVVDEILTPVLVELYPGGSVPVAVLEEGILDTVVENFADLRGAGLPPHQVRTEAQRRWKAHLDQLIELGVAVLDDGALDLTPLGRAGVRALALDEGATAPVIDDPAGLDAAALLRALPPLGRSEGEFLLATWSGARTPTQAISEIVQAARAGTAGTRLIALTVLKEHYGDHLLGAGREQVESLRDDPVLSAYAHALLTEPGQPVQFPPHLQQWVALETVAVALDSGVLDSGAVGGPRRPDGADRPEGAEALATLWQIIEQDADLDTAWRSSHPQLIDVLEAIAAHHPKGRVRKAAKKALFKTRSQRPSSPPARPIPLRKPARSR